MCNAEAARIFRQDKTKIENCRMIEYIYKNDRAGFLRELSDFALGSTKTKLRIEVRFKKGKMKLGWCRLNISKLGAGGGADDCMLALPYRIRIPHPSNNLLYLRINSSPCRVFTLK